LRREFREEQSGQINDSLLAIDKTKSHLRHLTLRLDHIVQDQVSQNHQHVLPNNKTNNNDAGPDTKVVIAETFVHQRNIGLNKVRIAESQVTKSNGNVGTDGRVVTTLEDGEQKLQVLFTRY